MEAILLFVGYMLSTFGVVLSSLAIYNMFIQKQRRRDVVETNKNISSVLNRIRNHEMDSRFAEFVGLMNKNVVYEYHGSIYSYRELRDFYKSNAGIFDPENIHPLCVTPKDNK